MIAGSARASAPDKLLDASTVFIVDDDREVRMSIALLVESIQLNYETFSAGQEFLKAYDKSRPGCLLLDVRMPGMSGLELQSELESRDARIPIIFLTGFGVTDLSDVAMGSLAATTVAETGGLLTIVVSGLFPQ